MPTYTCVRVCMCKHVCMFCVCACVLLCVRVCVCILCSIVLCIVYVCGYTGVSLQQINQGALATALGGADAHLHVRACVYV